MNALREIVVGLDDWQQAAANARSIAQMGRPVPNLCELDEKLRRGQARLEVIIASMPDDLASNSRVTDIVKTMKTLRQFVDEAGARRD